MAFLADEPLDGSPQSLRELDKRTLVAIILEQRKFIDEQKTELQKLVARVTELEKENRDLKARLNQNSTNSSKPPSSDPPSVTRKKHKKSKRRRGGQPGHEGTNRKMVPVEQVNCIEDHKPKQCKDCGCLLEGDDPEPQRHQVTEIPEVKPTTTEHRLHALSCQKCGAVTRASLPEGVPSGNFGPRLQSVVALFSGAYRLSKRNIVEVLRDCFGVIVSLGSICAMEKQVSNALSDCVEEAKEFVRQQTVAHADETGWREANEKAWLWTAVTAYVTVFLIRLSRATRIAKELLGEAFDGYLVSDRWGAYNWVDLMKRQLCWAHLIRDFQKIADFGGTTGRRGTRLVNLSKKLFKLWGRVRDGTLKRSSFQVYTSKIRVKIRRLLQLEASSKENPKAGMCKKILALEPAMWTFVRVEGVEPTNNIGERAMRHVVLWRKGSFGTQSQNGSRFVERILTTRATLRQQGRNVLDFLTDACNAALRNKASSSLLPAASNF